MALPELQPNSRKRLPESIVTGLTQSFTRARYQLMHTIGNPRGAGFLTVPREPLTGASPVIGARRRLMSCRRGAQGNFTHMLNTALLGGQSYPVLMFALGTGLGLVSGGASLLFSIGGLALDLSRTVQRVLVREGDEIWQVEQIGRSGNTVVHVGAYFIFDPFRNPSFAGGNGWLIHEERNTLDV